MRVGQLPGRHHERGQVVQGPGRHAGLQLRLLKRNGDHGRGLMLQVPAGHAGPTGAVGG